MQRFRPVTLERPKVLLPLVNAPLLDYTLEWLAMNAVDEVFVFCCAHSDQVEAHLAAAGWLRCGKFRVRTVVATNCLSAGDALRVLDQRDLIKSDFILVSGDVVSNVRLAPALAQHRARRAADRSALMTLVMRGGAGEAQRRRLGEGAATAVVDPATMRLLKVRERERERAPPLPAAAAVSVVDVRVSVRERSASCPGSARTGVALCGGWLAHLCGLALPPARREARRTPRPGSPHPAFPQHATKPTARRSLRSTRPAARPPAPLAAAACAWTPRCWASATTWRRAPTWPTATSTSPRPRC
jgi:hypothetical protein